MFRVCYTDAMIKDAPQLENLWKVKNENLNLFVRMIKKDIAQRPKGCNLFLFGRTNVVVTSEEDGYVAAEGYIESNVFNGSHQIQLQLD